jgi:hypothetical protein
MLESAIANVRIMLAYIIFCDNFSGIKYFMFLVTQFRLNGFSASRSTSPRLYKFYLCFRLLSFCKNSLNSWLALKWPSVFNYSPYTLQALMFLAISVSSFYITNIYKAIKRTENSELFVLLHFRLQFLAF